MQISISWSLYSLCQRGVDDCYDDDYCGFWRYVACDAFGEDSSGCLCDLGSFDSSCHGGCSHSYFVVGCQGNSEYSYLEEIAVKGENKGGGEEISQGFFGAVMDKLQIQVRQTWNFRVEEIEADIFSG